MIAKYGTFEYPLAERYRFEQELGRGAMGVVYRATDVRLGRPVAIKLLHPTLTNEVGVARFQSEVRIAAGLHHPNIVAVHESGEADGRLFYVMDYLGGETLRDRLKREKQLPVDDALSIVEQVATGLQHAHDHGIVHRDVKPENIILADGRASVLDFGLARALSDVGTERLTASGMAVGTPHYLSPEQAAAEKDVGPRADQYALACVLYELLAGEPPFTGPTASAIAMRHIAEEPRALRLRRKSTPLGVDAAVMRAMEKVPGDRFESITAFTSCLRRVVPLEASAPSSGQAQLPDTAGAPSRMRRLRTVGAAMIIGSIALPTLGWLYFSKSQGLDQSKVMLVATDTDTSAGLALRLVERGLREWRGLTVVSEVLPDRVNGSATSLPNGLKGARRLAARNLVMVGAELRRDSLDITARLYDAGGDTLVRVSRSAIPAAVDVAGQVMAIRRLVSGLLRDGSDLPWLVATDEESASLPAWRAFDAGRSAVLRWDLAAAESAFRRAISLEASIPLAHVWLAQTIAWSDTGRREEGRASASRGLAKHAGLMAHDSILAVGLRAFFSSDYSAACSAFRALADRDPSDLRAWLDLGDCQARDTRVIRDARSPTGWVFRSSFEDAARAYHRAVETTDDIAATPSFRGWILGRLSSVLFATTNHVRVGTFVGRDTLFMGAFPFLDGDTNAFAPHPISDFRTRKGDPPSAKVQAAAARSRSMLKAYVEDWVRAFPGDADALDSLARWSELSGGNAVVNGRQTPTLELLHLARVASRDSTQQLRLAIAEVRVLVKEGEYVKARAEDDSLLRAGAGARYRDVPGVIGLLALVGRVHETSRLLPLAHMEHRVQLPDGSSWIPPRPIEAAASSLLTYAVFGAYPDSVRKIARRTSQLIASYVPDTSRANAIRSVLVANAFGYGDPSEAHVDGFEFEPPDQVVRVVLQLSRGDSSGARRELLRLEEIDRGKLPGNGFRLAFRTARAWLALGDTSRAVAHLDELLLTLPTLDIAFMSEVSHVASVVRAFALRAKLAERAGDLHSAKVNAAAVVALWDGSDVELRAGVNEMRKILSLRP